MYTSRKGKNKKGHSSLSPLKVGCFFFVKKKKKVPVSATDSPMNEESENLPSGDAS